MKKVSKIAALVVIVMASCSSGPRVGDRQNGMVYGKGMSGQYEWMSESDYDRFFSDEARERGRQKLNEFNSHWDNEIARAKRSDKAFERLYGK